MKKKAVSSIIAIIIIVLITTILITIYFSWGKLELSEILFKSREEKEQSIGLISCLDADFVIEKIYINFDTNEIKFFVENKSRVDFINPVVTLIGTINEETISISGEFNETIKGGYMQGLSSIENNFVFLGNKSFEDIPTEIELVTIVPKACPSEIIKLENPSEDDYLGGASPLLKKRIDIYIPPEVPTTLIFRLEFNEGEGNIVYDSINDLIGIVDGNIDLFWSEGTGTAVFGEGTTLTFLDVDFEGEENLGVDIEYYDEVDINFVSVSASNYLQTCGASSDGAVYCWGYGAYGVLGDGRGISSEVPVKVVGIDNAIEVSVGYNHACALLSTGEVKCWGRNNYGQLGDNTLTQRLTPVTVHNISNAVKLAVGYFHACVLLSTGDVQCWGYNLYGQIGNGTKTTPIRTPVNVVDINNVISISSGAYFSCALLSNNQVRCWGRNNQGQLGNDTQTDSEYPITVIYATSNPLENVTYISMGPEHSCAVLNTGGIVCWGSNGNSRLGDGTGTTPRKTPVNVNVITNAVSVSGGNTHTCAVLSNDDLMCWGYNFFRALGDGTIAQRSSPVAVNSISDVQRVSCGSNYTCALLKNSDIKCWGSNSQGQLGAGIPLDSRIPITVGRINTGTSVSSGSGYHSCASLFNGEVNCWGYNLYGQLGDGTTTSNINPVTVSGINNALMVSLGSNHSCALLSTGEIMCWGLNSNGRLGDGTATQRTTPVFVSGINNAIDFSAGPGHNCSVSSTGEIMCWGINGSGRLGDGTVTERRTPVNVKYNVNDIVNTAIDVSASLEHSCGVLIDGTVICWGRNNYGQLGQDTAVITTSNYALTVPDINNAIGISVGALHSCALLSTGEVKCWGRNSYGQLSTGSTTVPAQSFEPLYVKENVDNILGNVIKIFAGFYSNCAILSTGKTKCWGYNSNGILGHNSANTRTFPFDVLNVENVIDCSVSIYHSCFLQANGITKCAGRKDYGYFGITVPFDSIGYPMVNFENNFKISTSGNFGNNFLLNNISSLNSDLGSLNRTLVYNIKPTEHEVYVNGALKDSTNLYPVIEKSSLIIGSNFFKGKIKKIDIYKVPIEIE